MRLIRHGYEEADGKPVIKHVEVVVPHHMLNHPERPYETCAICKNVLYPECTEKCAILRRDLESDREELT